MYLVRALNNYDVLMNPYENGIASKELIYKIVKNYYDKSNNKEYLLLNDLEKDLFIKEHIEEYLKEHNKRIKNKCYKYSNQSREDIKSFCELNRSIKEKPKEELLELLHNNKIDFRSFISLLKYLSTLQQHLLYGSSKMTDWISFSRDISTMLRYYEKQDLHKVAVIKSNTGGLVDSDHILSVDLSTYEEIKKKPYLCNKIDMDDSIIDIMAELSSLDSTIAAGFYEKFVTKTSPASRGFKYANNSKEVCIYKYVPKDHVVSILESLQIDLIRARLFDFDFIKLPIEEQKKELEVLKRTLEYNIINKNDPFLFHIFNDLYIENKNINSIINFQDSEEKVKKTRNKILGIAGNIYNKNIKR